MIVQPNVSCLPSTPGSTDVLIVDDTTSTLLSLQVVLNDIAQQVVCATSGTEALRTLLTHNFGVIILDFQLPDMNGLETARIIRTRERCKHIPIIFLTGYSYDELAPGDTTELGAIEFLLKPVPPDLLRAKVATLLNFVAW